MSKIWCHSCFFALQRGHQGMSSVPVHVVMSVCVSLPTVSALFGDAVLL